ncbi:SNF1-activating kinase 1, partial [Lecanoromycetidae sp. Uapishka_2]
MLHSSHHKEPKETHKLEKGIDTISGRKTINDYEILQKLGSGQHGTVKQGRDLSSGEIVAIKIVRRFSKKVRLGKSGDPNDMIKKEVAILKKARHPHVVSLNEVIDDAEFGKVYLVLEYVERGEIIWRKQTDKHIAVFEMGRTKREHANNVNEDYERNAVAEFNAGAPTRRLEKARLLKNQKRRAKERLESEGHQVHQGPNANPYWSLEFAGDTENDPPIESPVQPASHLGNFLPPGQGSLPTLTTGGSPQSDTPTHTPKPLPNPVEPQHLPASEPSSRPVTPKNLEGTMWSPYLEESDSDVALQSMLDQVIAGDTHWTAEEEDFGYVPCLTLSQALDAFRDTVLGLEYLHYQGIIHRDIKPANLLWTADYRVKISDFGVSYLGKPIREDDNKEEIAEADSGNLDEAIELAKTVGTPAFYAPELCDPQYFEIGKLPERPAITGQIDVWALGVTLYAMIFGRLPFIHTNEFQMYEKIAREDVFIPRMRLRGVEHTDRTPSNNNKRLDDILEYEEVDDELRDLLKRLLNKHPAKRITLKEVKHHPWVLKGIDDGSTWIDETDPSVQSQGKKIEVSTQEVQDAVVGLTLVDRVKAGIQRVGSVLRGRGSRKRADSNSKVPESIGSASPSVSKSSAGVRDTRRTSLRGDEQIYSALRASRENSEHPLAQSLAASPEMKETQSYFGESGGMRPASEPQIDRPNPPDRTLSTADSMKTIRAPVPSTIKETASPLNTSSPGEDFSTPMPVIDPNTSNSSSLGGIFGGAGRRFMGSVRSRERGIDRLSPSQSSRSSSVDTNIEDPHASPSLALSPAVAAGHVDVPPALREASLGHLPTYDSSAESFSRAQEENYRRITREYVERTGRRSTVSQAADTPCPPSPDDDIFYAQQRPPSAADSMSMFPHVSSSSDQIVSGESTAHSRIPSMVSGASSLSATIEEDSSSHALALEKSISPLTIGRSGPRSRQRAESELLNPRPALDTAAAEYEAGYNGEGEQDSDSDDEGLAMA